MAEGGPRKENEKIDATSQFEHFALSIQIRKNLIMPIPVAACMLKLAFLLISQHDMLQRTTDSFISTGDFLPLENSHISKKAQWHYGRH